MKRLPPLDSLLFMLSILPIIPLLFSALSAPYYSHYYAGIFGPFLVLTPSLPCSNFNDMFVNYNKHNTLVGMYLKLCTHDSMSTHVFNACKKCSLHVKNKKSYNTLHFCTYNRIMLEGMIIKYGPHPFTFK